MGRKLLLFLLVLLLFFLRLQTKPKNKISSGQKIRITATLSKEPKFTSGRQIFSLEGIVIFAFRYPEFHLGDRLVVEGIYVEEGLVNPQIEKVGEEKNLFSFLGKVSRNIENVFRMSLPQPQASLLSGLVLGRKTELPADFYAYLIKTGTVHVVVASGMNVAMFAGFLLSLLLNWISRRHAIIITILGIWFYVFLVGFEAPIVRAGIMGTIAFTASVLGRFKNAWRSLVVTVVLMLFINPAWTQDLSFQLSFASTLGILVLGPEIKKKIRIPLIGDDLATTLAATIATLPFSLFVFGRFFLLSPLVNGLVLWVVPLATAGGMIFGFLGLLWPYSGRIGILLL